MSDPPLNSKKMELICLDAQAFEMMFERLVEKIKEENKVQDNPYLNTKEACELLRCNDETLRKYWKEGHIAQAEFSNKHIVYERASLLSFIEKNTKKYDDGSK